MTYKELQDEIIQFRFNESRRSAIKRWLGHRYAMVWGAADWPFKFVHREDLTVASGEAAVPDAFRRPLTLETDGGEAVEYLTPAEFRFEFQHDDTATGAAEYFTVVNKTLYTGPAADGTYKLSYERRPAHLADGTTDTAGLMNSDNDTPIWAEEHHYVLVFGAMADGLKLENDNTWPALEDAYEIGVRSMIEDLIPAVRGVTLQYGRDGV